MSLSGRLWRKGVDVVLDTFSEASSITLRLQRGPPLRHLGRCLTFPTAKGPPDNSSFLQHAFTDRTVSLNRPGRFKQALSTPSATSEPLRQPLAAPKPSRANEEVVRARLDRPSAAPLEREAVPEQDGYADQAAAAAPRSLARRDLSDSPIEEEEPRRPPVKAQKPAPPPRSESEFGEDVMPATPPPNPRTARQPRPNPHPRAPVSSVALPPGPQSSRSSAREYKEDPPAPSRGEWDAPPPEPDNPASPDSWIQPPADVPHEGFEELWGDEKASKRSARRPAPSARLPSPPEMQSLKYSLKNATSRRDDSPSPERAPPSSSRPSASRQLSNADEPALRGRSDATAAGSSRRASSRARNLVDEGVEAIMRKEKELEERERRLWEAELEERERKLKEREAEVVEKERAREKAKERALDREEEFAFVKERCKEHRERSRSPFRPPQRTRYDLFLSNFSPHTCPPSSLPPPTPTLITSILDPTRLGRAHLPHTVSRVHPFPLCRVDVGPLRGGWEKRRNASEGHSVGRLVGSCPGREGGR